MSTLVKGFLKAQGRDFVNGDGEKILLRGVGLGNWLLPEGYMWTFRSTRADRPRRIEAFITELTGEEYARKFWKEFGEGYITEYDIKAIADEGFNHIRIPMNWRGLMKEGPGIRFIEEGFVLIDKCLDLCEKYNLYAFLDLHGAPGGQTGANIDDSIDDKPRLFMDQDNYDKCIALWVEIAKRYKDRYIVGGYDLLNEPIRMPSEHGNIDHYVGNLIRFYTDCIREIRVVDKKHMFTLEGHHWSTKLDIFTHLYDENMCIHFHRYWDAPDAAWIKSYIEASKRLNVPLWLGETGENSLEWFTTAFFMFDQHNISWNFWPWKKMDTLTSPCSINKPEKFQLVINYLNGEQHPGFEQSQEIFDEYLRNMYSENCTYHSIIPRQLLREKGCFVPAISYDTLPGIGKSFSGVWKYENEIAYRKDDNMRFVDKPAERKGNERKPQRGDNPWNKYNLMLTVGEWADYTVRTRGEKVNASVLVSAFALGSVIEIFVDDKHVDTVHVTDGAGFYKQAICNLDGACYENTVRIKVCSGAVVLDTVYFD